MSKQFKSSDVLLVTNRSTSSVGYPIPETDGRSRDFAPGETKKITYGEIEAACQQGGCRFLFHQYLLIQDPDAVEEATNTKEEIEYFMTPEQVKAWLPTCSQDEFLDALDFAPAGVHDLIKKYAIELPLTDMNKCQAIKDKLGLDVIAALRHIAEDKEDDAPVVEEKKERRAAVAQPTGTPARRAQLTLPDNK